MRLGLEELLRELSAQGSPQATIKGRSRGVRVIHSLSLLMGIMATFSRATARDREDVLEARPGAAGDETERRDNDEGHEGKHREGEPEDD